MARQERSGFVLYHDIVMNQLQYLPADEFRDVVIAAVSYSIALAKDENAPLETRFIGLAAGAYQSLCSSAKRSANKYWETSCRAKINRNKQDRKDLAEKDIRTLLGFGYTRRDIAYIKQMTDEELEPYFTPYDSTSQTVTDSDKMNRTEQNRIDLDNDIEMSGKRSRSRNALSCDGKALDKDKIEKLRREIDGKAREDAVRHLMDSGMSLLEAISFLES